MAITEQRRAYSAKWRAAHPDAWRDWRAYNAKYQVAHREHINELARDRHAANLEHCNELARVAYQRRTGAVSKPTRADTTFYNGRAFVYRPRHPHASRTGRIPRAWAVLEDAGRPCPGEIGKRGDQYQVHHKDEDTLHDVPSNLVWLTRSAHQRLHQARRKQRGVP